ncbi:LOW QUALITY PROTEIN: tektin bundle-interacting protein 1 [Phoenicopterus ruber ruber]
MELREHRPWVPQSTLEAEVPLPLYSDQYIMLWGLRQAPLLKQAVRWKTTPMGWDAAGQSWSTGLSGRDGEAEDPWYALASGIAHLRWQRARTVWGQRDPLPQEVAWWDPIIPVVYLGACTRWGTFLWQERPVLGKEYVVTRSQSPQALGGSSGYVPALSFCRPPLTTWDVSTWSHLHHQPSPRQ